MPLPSKLQLERFIIVDWFPLLKMERALPLLLVNTQRVTETATVLLLELLATRVADWLLPVLLLLSLELLAPGVLEMRRAVELHPDKTRSLTNMVPPLPIICIAVLLLLVLSLTQTSSVSVLLLPPPPLLPVSLIENALMISLRGRMYRPGSRATSRNPLELSAPEDMAA
jgi:hypothetical protein